MTLAGHDPDHEAHQLMTVAEVADALRVSRATVYRLVNAGSLPGSRVGKSMRVARRVVQDFLRDAGATGPPSTTTDTPTVAPHQRSHP